MSATFKTTTSNGASAPLPLPTSAEKPYLIPLSVIMLIALVIRLLAAFFSKGFAFHDEHFDVVEIAQNWVYHLPVWIYDKVPPRHSMFYAGIHYGLLYICEAIGITSPDGKMTVVRVLHGLYSLLIVYYGYKITGQLSNQRNARLVGLMLALMWFMPFMSVRYLVEMTCIPPYLAAFYLMLKPGGKGSDNGRYFWAGVLFALAFVLRYHTLLLAGGAGLVLLYQKQWVKAIFLGFGLVLMALLIQGTIDITFYKYPFQSVVTYFLYNSEKVYGYSAGPVYQYVLIMLGFMVPPLSVYLLLGYARTAKTAPLLFVAGLIFFVAHAMASNKQARFILPLFPILVILGVIGWQSFVQQSRFWQTRRKLLAASWAFFWTINIATAVMLAFTYLNKSRTAPLVYLSEKENLRGILLEFGDHRVEMPPLFYLGRMAAEEETFTADKKKMWSRFKASHSLPANFVMVYSLNNKKPLAELRAHIKLNYAPGYIVVVGQDDLQKRLQRIRSLYPHIKLEHTVEPSLYGQVLHRLNPQVYKDEQVRIYQVL